MFSHYDKTYAVVAPRRSETPERRSQPGLEQYKLGLLILNFLLLFSLLGCAVEQPALSVATPTSSAMATLQVIAGSTPPAAPTVSSNPTQQPHSEPTPRPTQISPTPAPPTPTKVPPDPSPTLTTTPAELSATSTATATLALAAVPPCACDSSCPCQIKHVVIISIDGLRPDALEQADTPSLDALRAQGAYNPAAKTVLPSVTLVSHASMLGGMSPEKHGIYWNTDDPDLGKVKGPTVFSVVHKAGLSTAMVVGKPKFEHLVLSGSVDNYDYAGFIDRQVTNEAVKVIQTNMPNLLFIHLPDVDSAGHALGWMSPGQLLAVSSTDHLIGEIVGTLEAEGHFTQTLLIITADHGGSGFKHGSDSPEDMTIPWLAVGPGVPVGVILSNKIITYDTAATALYAFGLPIPDIWDGRPVMEIFEPIAQ